MMLLLTMVSLLAILCCPPTIPLWAFILAGFYLSVRPQRRAQYIRQNGAPPSIGSRDWFVIYC